jgi:hypothetical protein
MSFNLFSVSLHHRDMRSGRNAKSAMCCEMGSDPISSGAQCGRDGRGRKSAWIRRNPREHAGLRNKKGQPRTVGLYILVAGTLSTFHCNRLFNGNLCIYCSYGYPQTYPHGEPTTPLWRQSQIAWPAWRKSAHQGSLMTRVYGGPVGILAAWLPGMSNPPGFSAHEKGAYREPHRSGSGAHDGAKRRSPPSIARPGSDCPGSAMSSEDGLKGTRARPAMSIGRLVAHRGAPDSGAGLHLIFSD